MKLLGCIQPLLLVYHEHLQLEERNWANTIFLRGYVCLFVQQSNAILMAMIWTDRSILAMLHYTA